MLRCIGVDLEVPHRVLCRGLTIAFEPGQVWAVLGRNGSGKTTLVHALAGLAVPARGRVELDGSPLIAWRARARAHAVGVLLQMEAEAYRGTAEDYVALGRYAHVRTWAGYGREDMEVARAALAAVGMQDVARRACETLSGGERQRVRIAQILAQNPRFLLLDEPLQHLDLAHQAHVLRLVAERVRGGVQSAVMVLHEPLWITRSCTHALLLSGDGSAHHGPADEILTRERLEHAYDCRLREIGQGAERAFVPDV